MLEILKVTLHEINSFDLIYLFHYSQKKIFFFNLETMLYCAFAVIVNPREESYLQSEIKKKQTWVKGFVRGKSSEVFSRS